MKNLEIVWESTCLANSVQLREGYRCKFSWDFVAILKKHFFLKT